MYNFEIHITVQLKDLTEINIFKEKCLDLKVKPIVINLFNKQYKDFQVMTSYTVKCKDLKEAKEIAFQQEQFLKKYFEILRVKIEVEPKYIEDKHENYHYLEIHVPCDTSKLTENIKKYVNLFYKGHISNNEFKPNVTFITFRTRKKSYIKEINNCIYILKEFHNIVLSSFKHHYEYAVYDSNINLDNEWMN